MRFKFLEERTTGSLKGPHLNLIFDGIRNLPGSEYSTIGVEKLRRRKGGEGKEKEKR